MTIKVHGSDLWMQMALIAASVSNNRVFFNFTMTTTSMIQSLICFVRKHLPRDRLDSETKRKSTELRKLFQKVGNNFAYLKEVCAIWRMNEETNQDSMTRSQKYVMTVDN